MTRLRQAPNPFGQPARSLTTDRGRTLEGSHASSLEVAGARRRGRASAWASRGWYFFLKTDPEPRAAIKETPIVTTTTVAGQAPASTDSALDGTWTVKPGNTQNFVGYRVTEKLFANISESEATGRTDNVTASMTIDGTTVKDVTVTADLRDLTSDNSFRDGRIRARASSRTTSREAKFVLTEPITLSAVPAAGDTIKTEATGEFTLHGVTKTVTISLEGRWDGKQVQVVGNLPIVFSDYGITAPTAPAVASVDDHGEMELQLFFDKDPEHRASSRGRCCRACRCRSSLATGVGLGVVLAQVVADRHRRGLPSIVKRSTTIWLAIW